MTQFKLVHFGIKWVYFPLVFSTFCIFPVIFAAESDTILDLRYQKIVTMTSDLLENKTSYKIIDLSYNELEFVTPHLFQNLKNLLVFKADDNPKFKARKLEAFLHSESLEEFSCVGCAFDSILEKTFTGLPSLEKLDWSHNKIKNINDRNAFSANLKLKFVNLSMNELDIVHSETFSMNGKLTVLDLSSNVGLKPQGKFISNTNLEILYVQNCNFEVVDEMAFSGLPNLRGLYLQGNKIHKVSPTAFQQNSLLVNISFENNRLEKLPLAVITDRLKNLCLDVNSFNLTRGYVRLFSKYEKRNLVKDENTTICENKNETLRFEWFVIKHKIAKAGISDAFISTYTSAIVLAEIVVLVGLVICFMKLKKKFKPEDLSQTILNDSGVYKIFKNE